MTTNTCINDGERFPVETKREVIMWAIKAVNLFNGVTNYSKERDYVSACENLRSVEREMYAAGWEDGVDYTMEIVEVDADFDFENQPEWN